MLKAYFQRILANESLTQAEMQEVIGEVMDGKVDPVQIAGFLVALRMKGESPSRDRRGRHCDARADEPGQRKPKTARRYVWNRWFRHRLV